MDLRTERVRHNGNVSAGVVTRLVAQLVLRGCVVMAHAAFWRLVGFADHAIKIEAPGDRMGLRFNDDNDLAAMSSGFRPWLIVIGVVITACRYSEETPRKCQMIQVPARKRSNAQALSFKA